MSAFLTILLLLRRMNSSTEISATRPLVRLFRPIMAIMTMARTTTRMRRKLRGRRVFPSSLRGESSSKSIRAFILHQNARVLPLLFKMRNDPAREAVEGLPTGRFEAFRPGRREGHPLDPLVAPALAAVGAG